MFSLLVLAVVVVFGSACESACEGEKQEVLLESLRELSQEEAELILNAETTLRSHFIWSLAKLREKIVGATSFYSVVEEILQGLRSRDLSPLRPFENGYSVDDHRPPAHQLAALIHSLQRCSSQELNFDDWHSFLRTIPNIETIIPSPPDIRITPQHLHKANSGNIPFVLFVLLAVHHNHLAPTATLLRHVLYNYRYKNYSPDLDVIAQSLNIGQSLPKTDPTAVRPHEILSGLLESLPPRGDSVLAFQTTILLSALSSNENIGQTRISPPWQLFGLIGSGDYPPDIVQAAAELSAVVKNQQVNISEAMLWGYSPLEQLLSVVTQLMTVRSTNPVSVKVHALYPHIKLKFLSYKQKFFRPRTSFDVALLLNSFLTTPSAAIIGEVHKIFLLPQFNWQNILKSFDYSKYSKPRSLFLALLQELLRNPHELPTCGLITFSIFLRQNSGVPNCRSEQKISSDIINETVHGQITPIFPDSLRTARCPDGSPVELIDPDSIVEIMEANDCTAFIADLIKTAPMPVEKYPQRTRRSVYHVFLNNLQTAMNDTLAVRAIQQALNQTVLNDKADLSPKYLRLCPSKVTVMAAKPRAQSLLSLCRHQSAGNPQEMLTGVNNAELPLNTPREFLGETSRGGNLTKVFLIPLNSNLSYGNARALEDLLDQLSTSTTDQTLLSHVDKVKSHVRTVHSPAIVSACLPQTQSQQKPQGCKCQENESSVAVVNTTTLVPCTLCARRVLDRIKFFIIAVDTSEKVTKRDVLLDILSYFEQSDDAYNAVGVNELKEIILKSDETLEEADVLRVCMPNAVIEDMHQQTPETLEMNAHNPQVLVTAALQHSLTPPEPATANPLPVTKVNLSPSHSSPVRLPFSSFSRPLTMDTATESTQTHPNNSTSAPFEKTLLLPSVTSQPKTETSAINKTKTLDAPANDSSALNANYFDTSNISSATTATATAFPSATIALSALTIRKNKFDTSTTNASSAFSEIHSSTTHVVPLSRQIDHSFSSTTTPYPFVSITPFALKETEDNSDAFKRYSSSASNLTKPHSHLIFIP